jgi:hypothetical protein
MMPVIEKRLGLIAGLVVAALVAFVVWHHFK